MILFKHISAFFIYLYWEKSRLLQFYVLVGVMLMSLIVMSIFFVFYFFFFFIINFFLVFLSLSIPSSFSIFHPFFFVPLCFPTRSHPPLSTLRCFSCRTSDPRQSELKLEQEYEGEFFSRVTFLMIHFFRSLAEGGFHIIYSCPHLKQKSLFTFLKKKKE